MADIFTIALRFDPLTGVCDVAVENGALAIDRTPVTAMLIALGSDARARPDDVLPHQPDAAPSTALALNPWRGWPGDALDRRGRRLGSRLWLLIRAKQSEETRRRAIAYAEEPLAGVSADLERPIEVSAEWIRRNTLGLLARAGAAQLRIPIQVGA